MDNKLKKVFVVFKTHFDIGYTHLAKELLEWYGSTMIKDVAEVCKATSNLPEGRKYVWTVPSWPLTKTVSGIKEPGFKEQIEKLIEEGQLIWHGIPFTMHTEFCGMEEFVRGLYVARELSEKYGRWTADAKMTDVPGHTWILPSILTKAGIKFLHLGSNFCATPPDVPRIFFWEGPDGSRVLTYYSKGDYGTDLIPPEDWDYPYWLAMLQTLDNLGAQDTDFLAQMFKRAEKELPGTEVSIGSLEDFGRAMLEGDYDIPVIKGDLADTWIRGVGSAPAGVSMLRSQRPILSTLESVVALNKMNRLYANSEEQERDRGAIALSYEKMLLFGEHTWSMDTKVTILPERYYGAPWIGFKFWETGVYNKEMFDMLKEKDPGYLKLQESWQEQLDYLREADSGIRSLKNGSLKALAASVDVDGERIVIASSLGWQSNRQVILEDALPSDYYVDYLLEPVSGEKLPVYVNYEGKRCVDANIPALGYKALKVVRCKGSLGKSFNFTEIAKVEGSFGILENKYIKIEVDMASGCLTSLYHKPLGKEWVDEKSELGFGQYVYDIFSSKELNRYLCDYSYVLRDWGVNDFGKAGYPKDQRHLRFTPQCFDMEADNGFNWGKLTLSAVISDQSAINYGNARKVRFTVVMYEDKEYIDLKFDLLDKLETPLIESGHFVFPLALENPSYRINKLGSVIDPEKDIVSGCNKDLHCMEKWVDISNGDYGIAVVSYDMPLFSFCEPGILKFERDFAVKQPTLLMQAFNNAWGTNFPQWIGGNLSYRYRLVLHKGDWKSGEVWKVAEETLKTGVVGYSDRQKNKIILPPVADLMVEGIDGFEILAFKPSEDGVGYILRICEVKGEEAKHNIKLLINIKQAFYCDLLERKTASVEMTKQNGGCNIEFYSRKFEIITFCLII